MIIEHTALFPPQSVSARKNNPHPSKDDILRTLARYADVEKARPQRDRAENAALAVGLLAYAPLTDAQRKRKTTGRYLTLYLQMTDKGKAYYEHNRPCMALIPYGYDQKRDPMRHWCLDQLYVEHSAHVQAQRSLSIPF